MTKADESSGHGAAKTETEARADATARRDAGSAAVTREPAAPGTREESLACLLGIMAALRDPETGCPWDLKQSFETIAPYTIEEAYEVADAIERGDMADLKDELGDLLLQVVYHSQLAAERGLFDFHDVAAAIAAKMVRRHPHVFGDSPDASGKRQWDAIKRQEREEKARTRPAPGGSTLFDDIPVALPSLQRSAKLQRRASQIGFDWPDIAPLQDKVDEEWAELRAEIDARASPEGAQERIAEEFGDLLFVLANLGLHLGVDADAALRAANMKFMRRMAAMDRMAQSQGQALRDLNLDEMEALWVRVKEAEREGPAKE